MGRISDFGFRISDFGFRISDFGWRISDGGWRISDGGYRGSGFVVVFVALSLGSFVGPFAEAGRFKVSDSSPEGSGSHSTPPGLRAA